MRARQKVSRAGVELIKSFEGLRSSAARLPDGRWTLGYGHTFSAREGARVTQEDADALLRFDLLPIVDALNNAVLVPLNQNQFDALVSFCFNIGVDNFAQSTVLKRINEGRMTEAALAMDAWRSAEFNGQTYVLAPLIRRRAAEKNLFLTPDETAGNAPTLLVRPVEDAPGHAAFRPSELDAPDRGGILSAFPVGNPEPVAPEPVRAEPPKPDPMASFYSPYAQPAPATFAQPAPEPAAFAPRIVPVEPAAERIVEALPDHVIAPVVEAAPTAFGGAFTIDGSPEPQMSPAVQAALARAQEEQRQREEAARLEEERIERERLERERLAVAEAERLRHEEYERARLAAEQARLDYERQERERLAAVEAERQRIAAEDARREMDRQELARVEALRLEVVRQEEERQERERQERERQERERMAAAEAERQRVSAEQAHLEQVRQEQARLEQERLERERLEQERLERERQEQARLELARQEQERLERERLERERAAAEQARFEQERLERDRLEREQAAAAAAKPSDEEAEKIRKAEAAAALMRLYSPYGGGALGKPLGAPLGVKPAAPAPAPAEEFTNHSVISPQASQSSPILAAVPAAEPEADDEEDDSASAALVMPTTPGVSASAQPAPVITAFTSPYARPVAKAEPVAAPTARPELVEVPRPEAVDLSAPSTAAIFARPAAEPNWREQLQRPLPEGYATPEAPAQPEQQPSLIQNSRASRYEQMYDEGDDAWTVDGERIALSSEEMHEEGVSWGRMIMSTLRWIFISAVGLAALGVAAAAYFKSHDPGVLRAGVDQEYMRASVIAAAIGTFFVSVSVWLIMKRLGGLKD